MLLPILPPSPLAPGLLHSVVASAAAVTWEQPADLVPSLAGQWSLTLFGHGGGEVQGWENSKPACPREHFSFRKINFILIKLNML